MFEPGEVMGILPTNCFVLNSINNPSIANLVSALKKAKTLFKPGSYIFFGSTYYKIAEDNQSYPNKPYIGVYKYANENNTADVRANIVIMLEDVEYTPTYPSNTRFDIFDNDNVLDYWPEKGKVMIGDLELCDFAKTGDPTSNTGYTITLQREMEQYFPSYIRDWEGLDPLESLSQDVTVGSFIPTSLKLADPVDVTCTGLKRIAGISTNPITNSTVTHGYIAPDGKYNTTVAKINIKSDTDQVVAKEKLSIGQVVHLPYRDLSVNFSYSPFNTSSFKIGSPLGVAGSNVSTNRAGDLRLSGKLTSGTVKYFRYDYRYHMFNTSRDTASIYDSVNSLATCKVYWSPGGNNRLSGAGYYMTPNGIRFYRYRWYSLDGTTYTGGSSLGVQIASGDTMYIQTDGEYDASLSNTGILTVTSVSTGGLFLGQSISGTGIPANAYISGYAGYSEPAGVSLSGRGGTGTYLVSVAGAPVTSAAASTTIVGSKPANGQDYAVYYPGQTGYWQRRITSKSYNASNGKTTLTFNSTVTNTFTGGSILMYSYGASDDNVVLALDKALINDPNTTPGGSGNELQLGWNLSDAKSNSSACKTFKSRIIDIGDNSSGGIDLYLADPLPEQYTGSTNMRHYGFLFVNYGGWTYPSQGGSSYRSNNAALGSSNTTMILPNRAGRIQPGDTIRYSYEDDVSDSSVQASPLVKTYSGQVSNVAAVDAQGYSIITLSTSSDHILYSGHTHKQQWLSLGDIFVSHRTGNFVTNGPVMNTFIYSDTGLKMKFGEYRMWHANLSYLNITNGITGLPGWVGNFALSSSGKKVGGLSLNGASAIQWGRQYNSSVWMSAHPTTPRWVGFSGSYSSSDFSNHMIEIQEGGSIESWMSNISTIPSYEGSGSENTSFYPINHSHLTCGSLFAGLNTSNSEFGYVGAYDVAQYQWKSSSTKLNIGLQDGVVNTTSGQVTSGGGSSRVTEGLIISHVQHYKPTGWPSQDAGVSFNINSYNATGNITSVTNSATVSGSSTLFTADILPGDQLYSEEGDDQTPTWIGTVASVSNNESLTLRSNAAVATSSDGTWSVISSRVKKAGDNAPNESLIFSGNSQDSGLSVLSGGVLANRISDDFAVPGNNVIKAGSAGYDRYNFAFRISKRTYNQTPLLNTRGEITPVVAPNDARKVMMPKIGDLSEFQGQIMNIDVTRLNPKTHIERSISIVGDQINI